MALTAIAGMNAQQPYSGCWHPDDIRNWSPETDRDAKFNRSRVPLAKRFKEPQLMKANDAQWYDGQICNATILFPTCSRCPSQEDFNFVGYQPTYLQYMDKMVYWAGSATKGIICPPPAGSTDAAHRAGVRMLGQIFFPPVNYGGTELWPRQMVLKENGHYPMAIKLYEIAKYMGFDGWFINEEIHGTSRDEWKAFMDEFYAAAKADGDTNMEIMWYDNTGVPKQDLLNTSATTSQFLEYNTGVDHRDIAPYLECTDDGIFAKLYNGVECVKSGLTGYNRWLRDAFPASGHVGSLALFCPEEHSWKDYVRDLISTSNGHGKPAYEAMQGVFEAEEAAWVNRDGDPSWTPSADGSGSAWRGISGCILERSVIDHMPFVSNMCVGIGKHHFVNGELCGSRDWWHSGVQSILPTWRWWLDGGELSATIDWDDAYNFGSSFKIAGKLNGNALVRLYKTQIPVTDGGKIIIAVKGSDTPELKLPMI